MPVNVNLNETKQYLIYTMSDPLEMPDLYAAYAKEKELRDSQPHTIHSLVDMTGLTRIPPNWLTAKAGPGLTHPRSGQMVFCGVSMGLKIVLNTIFKITRYERMKFFDTHEEAEAYIQQLVSAGTSQTG